MRKTRFLMILTALLLLLFAVALLGCQGEKPPEEPPVDPPAEPLVIEQGEIIVSDYWKNIPIVTNPIPSEVAGTALPYEELGFYVVETLTESGEEPPVQCADSLNEAAVLVQQSGVLNLEQAQIDALCDKLSHVDFSQFRLLVLYDWFEEKAKQYFTPWALVHDGAGTLTLLYEIDPIYYYLATRGERNSLCARFVLVRRDDYGTAKEQIQSERMHYKAPVAIKQGEIVISDYWNSDPIAVNPRPEQVEGTPLCFEQLCYVGADMVKVRDTEQRFFVADDLDGATELIRNYASYSIFVGNGFDTVCEAVSHVDFSQFRLLLFLEVYGSGSLTHHYVMEGLVHDGEGKLTKMMLNPPFGDRAMTDDMAYMARFLLVRRADYDVPADEAEGVSHFYRPYPDPIEQGEIVVSDYWQSAAPAENPCPDVVSGVSLPYEELAFYKSHTERAAQVRCADDLAAAALLIDEFVYEQGGDKVAAMREKVSHVDFTRFRLLTLIEVHDESLYPFPFRLDALIHDGSGLLTAVCYKQEQSYPTYAVKNETRIRFVLVRRADYDVATEVMHCATYTYADPPNVIEQGEITVSAHWDVIERPANYYKYYCDGPALQFEQLGMIAVEYKIGKDPVLVDSLDEAAAVIDQLTSYNSAGCLALNEIASHVDFSEFRLMLIGEQWYSTDRMENCYLDTIIYKAKNLHTVYSYYDYSGPEPGSGNGATRYVRVVLLHRSQLDETPEFYQRHN